MRHPESHAARAVRVSRFAARHVRGLRRWRRALRGAVQTTLAVWAITASLFAQGGSRQAPEYDVKAAYLYNFMTLTQWPSTAFASASAPVRVCSVGDDPFDGALERTLQRETVAGRPIVIRRPGRADLRAECQVVFIPRDVAPRPVLEALDRSPVLTVGESPAFAETGGMIVLVPEAGRIRFEVNRTVAIDHGLVFSARLLEVARRVR